jgi:two-component system, LytTR family, sensor kinase
LKIDSEPILPHSSPMSSDLSDRMNQTRPERAKSLFFLCFLALLTAFDTIHNYVAHQGDGTPISASVAIQWGIGYWLPYFFLVPAAVFLVERYRLQFDRIRSFFFHGVAGLVFAYTHNAIAAAFDPGRRLDLPYEGRFFLLLGENFSIDYVFYCSIVVAAYMLQQYGAFKEREIRASQLEAGLAHTHLRVLQAQLNPHFFFNTLQAISALALAGERDSVVEMLSRLSDLIRISFDEHRPQQIPLRAELEFLESYLAMHQLTFGDRLTVHRHIDTGTLEADVPAMMLQPLVENAIMHGIAVKPGSGTIRLEAHRENNTLLLEVADSGSGFGADTPAGNGIGLSATESRLQLLYGDAHSIEYGRAPEGGASVSVRIPFTASRVDSLARVPQRAYV